MSEILLAVLVETRGAALVTLLAAAFRRLMGSPQPTSRRAAG